MSKVELTWVTNKSITQSTTTTSLTNLVRNSVHAVCDFFFWQSHHFFLLLFVCFFVLIVVLALCRKWDIVRQKSWVEVQTNGLAYFGGLCSPHKPRMTTVLVKCDTDYVDRLLFQFRPLRRLASKTFDSHRTKDESSFNLWHKANTSLTRKTIQHYSTMPI